MIACGHNQLIQYTAKHLGETFVVIIVFALPQMLYNEYLTSHRHSILKEATMNGYFPFQLQKVFPLNILP